jgi:hypothetical protein
LYTSCKCTVAAIISASFGGALAVATDLAPRDSISPTRPQRLALRFGSDCGQARMLRTVSCSRRAGEPDRGEVAHAELEQQYSPMLNL